MQRITVEMVEEASKKTGMKVQPFNGDIDNNETYGCVFQVLRSANSINSPPSNSLNEFAKNYYQLPLGYFWGFIQSFDNYKYADKHEFDQEDFELGSEDGLKCREHFVKQ